MRSLISAILSFVGNFAFILLAIVALIILLSLPEPRTVLAVEAHTESVRQKIVSPDQSAFFITGGQTEIFGSQAAETEAACSEDPTHVSPGVGSDVTYRRYQDGVLVVVVSAPATVEAAGEVIALGTDQVARITVDPNSGCSIPSSLRLPLNGDLEIGQEPQIALDPSFVPAIMSSAEITVYARAVERLFFLPLNFGPFEPGAFYVADGFPLPPSSHIDGAARLVDGKLERAVWWGNADLSFDEGSNDMVVRAAVTANELSVNNLALFDASGSSADSPTGDRISLTLSARLLGDPNLRIIYAFIGFILIFRAAFNFQNSRRQ